MQAEICIHYTAGGVRRGNLDKPLQARRYPIENYRLAGGIKALRHVAELVISRRDQLRNWQAFESGKMAFEGVCQQGRGFFVIGMGSALRLGNNAINASQLGQVIGGNFQGLCRIFFLGASRHMMEAQPSGEMTE